LFFQTEAECNAGRRGFYNPPYKMSKKGPFGFFCMECRNGLLIPISPFFHTTNEANMRHTLVIGLFFTIDNWLFKWYREKYKMFIKYSKEKEKKLCFCESNPHFIRPRSWSIQPTRLAATDKFFNLFKFFKLLFIIIYRIWNIWIHKYSNTDSNTFLEKNIRFSNTYYT
jgi:hypothetical protein